MKKRIPHGEEWQRPSPSSFSWLLDNNNRPHQSQWLQTTLTELDWKIKKILEVVEDNGDTFAERAEMYYQKRPELIKMVGDLHRSYRALADKYDLMLRSESLRASSNSFRQVRQSEENSASVPIMIEAPAAGSVSGCDHQSCSCHQLAEQQKLEGIADEEDVKKMCRQRTITEKKVIITGADKCEGTGGGQWEKVEEKEVAARGLERKGWEEMLVEVSELIEENTNKQAELIERYNKKRDDVKQLVKENRRLREVLAQRKTPTNSTSKWKSTLFGKFSFA